jgi:flagellar basal-body rod protein FlgF
MDPLTALAASGLRSRMESLEMLANNVANAATGGYKSDREFYSLYVAPEAADPYTPATMPLIDRPWTDFSQGSLRVTGNSLDVALTGKGFFTVAGPSGPLYTRNGSFHTAASGALVTADEYPVRGVGGTPLNVDAARPLEISADGTVTQEGQVIGQLEIADFTSTAGLVKHGNNYFQSPLPPPRTTLSPDTTVRQGHLEDSNTNNAEAAVRLIGVMRQFEMLQKAVSIGADMDQRAIQEVARVGS